MKLTKPLLVAFALLLVPAGALAQAAEEQAAPVAVQPRVYDADVVAVYPHDPHAFTQGLLWHDGALYESTGMEGESEIRRVDLASGEVLQRQPIPPEQFGEGMTLWGDQLVSLTWLNQQVHRWDLATLAPVATQDFPFEGWGLTDDGTSLIASDGSSTLRFLDPATLAVQRELTVTLGGREVDNLNELEMIDGLIYANVWFTGFLLGIDPATGAVERVVDLRPLVPANQQGRRDAVLNGMAFDPDTGRLWVTGKRWPNLYQIQLIEREGAVAGTQQR
ncbi:MAG: glutaminyl-peptide cyclotransferase [Erythrobacter sp.]|nr:glutaminyl-peptide cyclotransferase [Erythrobacter sp.]